MKKQQGFTLIELIVVIVILGILAATAMPKFLDLSVQATTAAKAGMTGAIRSARTIEYARNAAAGAATNPSVTTLAAAIEPAGVAVATGVQVSINGTNHIAPTFTDVACTVATTAVGDLVACVGPIP